MSGPWEREAMPLDFLAIGRSFRLSVWQTQSLWERLTDDPRYHLALDPARWLRTAFRQEAAAMVQAERSADEPERPEPGRGGHYVTEVGKRTQVEVEMQGGWSPYAAEIWKQVSAERMRERDAPYAGDIGKRTLTHDLSARAAPVASELPFRAEVEELLGASLGDVRAYMNQEELLSPHGARAAAFRGGIAFAGTPTKEVVAHEAVHTLQLRTAGVTGDATAAEVQAENAARAVAHGAQRIAMAYVPTAAVSFDKGSGSSTGSAATVANADTDEETLPENVTEFAVAPDGWSALVRTAWVTRDLQGNLLKVLRQMQRLGAFTWAKEEGLRRAAEKTPPIDGTRKVVRYSITLRSLAQMGLPPLSGAMVAREGDDLVIAVKVPGMKDDDQAQSHPLGLDDGQMVYRAIEKFTGLAIKTHPHLDGLIIRDGIVEVHIRDAQAATMFGAKDWSDWKKSRGGATTKSVPGDKPAEVSSELSLSEKMHVEGWLKANLGIVDSGPVTHIDRSTLNVIDDIEKNPDLKPIIKQLVDKKTTSPGQVAGTFALEELLEAAKTERDRHRLGTDQLDQGNTTPLDASAKIWDIDGRIVQKGLVFADREMTFTLELDWELWKTFRSADDIDLFAKRAWHDEIEWAVERIDKPGKTEVFKQSHDHSSDIKLDHTFKLGTGETSGQFKVHAFMRSSHFAPKHLTAVIEVKTEEARMDELRARDLGDMTGGGTMMMNYEFDIGTGQKILGPVAGDSRDTHGYAISGPLPKDFKHTDPQQRKQGRDDELEVQKKLVEYLRKQAKDGKVGYGDAIAAAEQRIKFLEGTEKKLAADETSGWKPFEVRGTYLSRNAEVMSGALELYGNYRVSMSREPAGFAAVDGLPFKSAENRPPARPRFEVMIRDLSNKLESDLEFPGEGEHFDDALRDAFIKLAKAYPDGKVSVLAEDFALDNGLGKPNGRSIGYELATTSAWGRVKSKVYDPVVQVLTNAAAMAVMIIFPPSAAVIVPMLAVTDIVNNVDHMVSNRDKGKLTFQNASIDLLTIGLDVLPALRGAKLLNPAKSAIQEAKGLANMRLVLFDAVQFGGQFIVMYERTKEQLVEIQDKQISAMAEKYRALIALQEDIHNKKRNESDPGLRQKQADIEADAKAIRDTVTTTWTQAVQHQATFFVGSHLVGGHEEAAAGTNANRDTHFEREIPREVTALRKTAANTFETDALSLRVVHAHYAGEGVQTSAIAYDHETGTAHFDITDKTTGTKTRIEAPNSGDKNAAPIAATGVTRDRTHDVAEHEQVVPGEPVGAHKPMRAHEPVRAREQAEALEQARLAKIRAGSDHIRGPGELPTKDVVDSMNAQLQNVKARDVDAMVEKYSANQQARMRTVLARSSGFGKMEGLNALRTAMEPHLHSGKKLYTPGQGSLADNMYYLDGEKHSFDTTHANPTKPDTTPNLELGCVVILDRVVLAKMNDPKGGKQYANDLVANHVVLLDPRGFVDGNNMYNSRNREMIAQRADAVLKRATEIETTQKISFDEAVGKALDETSANAIAGQDPAVAAALKAKLEVVDPASHAGVSSAAIADQMSSSGHVTEEQLEASLAKVPEADRAYLRELLSQQAEIFSPRRQANELAAQGQKVLDLAASQGISRNKVFYFIPEEAKSYGMVAMAHREATGTPVEHYIEGPDKLKEAIVSGAIDDASMLVILDDVAGSGDSLARATTMAIHSHYHGKLAVSPIVSTGAANQVFNGPFGIASSNPNVAYVPGRIAPGVRETEYYKKLPPNEQRRLENDLLVYLGWGNNGLSMAFPYMAPDNNNQFFGKEVAREYVINRNDDVKAVKTGGSWVPKTTGNGNGI